jgi:ketosteroid isomerase-like protein
MPIWRVLKEDIMKYHAFSAVLFAASLTGFPLPGLSESDPVAVFRQAIDARNRGGIAAMMALFTDDAVRVDGSCQPPCVGLAAVRLSFQKNVDEHFQAKVTSAQRDGDTVTATAEITSDASRAQGIEKRMTSYTIQLRGGNPHGGTRGAPLQSDVLSQRLGLAARQFAHRGGLRTLWAQERNRSSV